MKIYKSLCLKQKENRENFCGNIVILMISKLSVMAKWHRREVDFEDGSSFSRFLNQNESTTKHL